LSFNSRFCESGHVGMNCSHLHQNFHVFYPDCGIWKPHSQSITLDKKLLSTLKNGWRSKIENPVVMAFLGGCSSWHLEFMGNRLRIGFLNSIRQLLMTMS